jgi:hypothetical protein
VKLTATFNAIARKPQRKAVTDANSIPICLFPGSIKSIDFAANLTNEN